MRFVEQKIKGCFLIEAQPFQDDRGVFRRHFCAKEYADAGIDPAVAQANVSENKFKHTLRGFHYQHAPHQEAKTITVIKGSIYDVVLDLRKDSATFGQWYAVELDENSRTSIHIPKGCANAFLSLSDDTVLHYYSSQFYCASAESGIRYNDPFFKIDWPFEPKVISDKDNSWPDYTS